MQIWLKTATRDWADVAEKLACPDVVNLWQIGAHRAWRGPAAGDLILIRREGTRREIVGYGRFVGTTCHALAEAWDLFGLWNGAWSADRFRTQVAMRCGRGDDSVELACALIADPVFYPPLNAFVLPDAFPTNKTFLPLCRALAQEGRILIKSLRHHAGRSLIFGETPQARLLGYRTYRVPGTVVRVDDRVLRSLLAEMYGHRCAISEGRVAATLNAAHPWPLQYGGPDDLGNRLLLDVRPHWLWDRRLIGVDETHRIMVSNELRLAEPTSDLLRRAGKPLRRRTSGNPYPDEANLRWHRDHLFRWPKVEP